jgi:hypothetical protein
MSAEGTEGTITGRVGERPSVKLGNVRGIRRRDLVVRFIAGAATSICAGVVTLAFGPRAGGLLLAFPAILAASLTLIDQQEDSAEARQDARGAVIGGAGLAAFAAVAAVTLPTINAPAALLLATLAWFATALLGYLIAWFR